MKIFTPYSIGNITIKNRLIMPAMGTGYAGSRGEISDRLLEFYVERAKGGIGAIITESIAVRSDGKLLPNSLTINSEENRERIKQLNKLVHQNECKIFYQLAHAGRETLARNIGGRIPVSPSGISCPVMKQRTRALDVEEIEQLEDSFASAALKIKESGADGVEFHMAHGYLVCQFLSEYSNQRDDVYGANIDNRCRFAVNILKKTREKTGNDFAVICRISANEYVERGIELAQSIIIAKKLEDAGASAVHVSACNYESSHLNIPNYYREEACFIEFAKRIKESITVPIIGVGKLKNKKLIDKYLKDNSIDFAAVGRPLIADPFLPAKWEAEKDADIKPCLSCNHCFSSISEDRLRCSINPALQSCSDKNTCLEITDPLVVIGGGISGCNAAVFAAEAGFKNIELYEKESFLGGQLQTASLLHEKQTGYSNYLAFLEKKMKEYGVRVYLDSYVSENKIKDILNKNDRTRIIFATGISFNRVLTEYDLPSFIDYTDTKTLKNLKGSEIVIIGGGAIGLELADYLSESNKKITILEKKPKTGTDIQPGIKYFLNKKLTQKSNVEIITKCRIEDIAEGKITYKIPKSGIIKKKFDNIVFAHIRENNDYLYKICKKYREKNCYLIGDAYNPGKIIDAVKSAYNLINKIISEI